VTCYRLEHLGIEYQWGWYFLRQSSLLYNGYWISFPRVKRPGCGIDHAPPSSSKVKEMVELNLYSPNGLSWPVLGWALPLHLPLPCKDVWFIPYVSTIICWTFDKNSEVQLACSFRILYVVFCSITTRHVVNLKC
jgi:hypothetical protein